MEILTTKQAADILGITQRRINALIQAGKLPAQVFGGVYMIQESDLALVSDRKAGRPKKEGTAEASPPTKTPANRTTGQKKASVEEPRKATKKPGGKS